MNSHDVDTKYLNRIYVFWSNLFFGQDDKTESATATEKPAEGSKPKEAQPNGPSASASYYVEGLNTNAGAAGFNPGAAIYYGNSTAALAKYSMHFKVLNFAATIVAGFFNMFVGESGEITDPPVYTNYASGCNQTTIPPDNIELRHRSMRNQPASDCSPDESTSAPKAKTPEKPECRAAYIPFESIEYRYGNQNGIMHLPVCSNN